MGNVAYQNKEEEQEYGESFAPEATNDARFTVYPNPGSYTVKPAAPPPPLKRIPTYAQDDVIRSHEHGAPPIVIRNEPVATKQRDQLPTEDEDDKIFIEVPSELRKFTRAEIRGLCDVYSLPGDTDNTIALIARALAAFPKKVLTRDEFDKFEERDLRTFCQEIGIPHEGSKSDLIDRLIVSVTSPPVSPDKISTDDTETQFNTQSAQSPQPSNVPILDVWTPISRNSSALNMEGTSEIEATSPVSPNVEVTSPRQEPSAVLMEVTSPVSPFQKASAVETPLIVIDPAHGPIVSYLVEEEESTEYTDISESEEPPSYSAQAPGSNVLTPPKPKRRRKRSTWQYARGKTPRKTKGKPKAHTTTSPTEKSTSSSDTPKVSPVTAEPATSAPQKTATQTHPAETLVTGKRKRVSLDNGNDRKRRKISPEEFIKGANLPVVFDGFQYEATPIQLSEKSYGWLGSGEQMVDVNGSQFVVKWELDAEIEDVDFIGNSNDDE